MYRLAQTAVAKGKGRRGEEDYTSEKEEGVGCARGERERVRQVGRRGKGKRGEGNV
jgi:hypothetical protein